LAIAKDKPVDLSILHAPDDVFTDAATTVDVELLVEIDAHAAGCDLRDQFGGSFNVVIFRDAGLTTALGINHQQCVGLGLIVQVEPGTGVVGGDNTFREGLVYPKPN